MKKTIAIGFLLICLFNISGPLILRQYASYLAERFYNKQISNGLYNKSDLTEIKLPAHMPNITDWPGYENVSGQIKFDDVAYNYVAMRITRTAIYLKCVPNYETTRLSTENVLVSKGVSKVPVSPKDHLPTLKILLVNQISPVHNFFQFTTPVTRIFSRVTESVQSLCYTYLSIPEQPPKFVA
ncbi:hypothetical protein D0C36_10105 [Mucilaginibacter conchicola]|uniref:Uncharacterized protein n=1 Tax=Mucilaginibacter conchicola TaxID=2303333 RepID=A0A372NT71_9SPHI|nr:hypothetical protein [Mucilaginibacter conchicola]RFZ91797.1 hypothetical protein D0C36_10105 [Mucilaginibacter conchicola]